MTEFIYFKCIFLLLLLTVCKGLYSFQVPPFFYALLRKDASFVDANSDFDGNFTEMYSPTDNSLPKPQCDENRLMLQLAELYIISPETIILQISIPNYSIDEKCNAMNSIVRKIEKDFKNCTKLSDNNLYMKLYNGLVTFRKNFCQNEKLKMKLERFEDCFQELVAEFMDCEGPADWYESSNSTTVCHTLDEILKCNYIRTSELCGSEGADIVREISVEILMAVVKGHGCKISNAPDVDSPMLSFAFASNHLKFSLKFAICSLMLTRSLNLF